MNVRLLPGSNDNYWSLALGHTNMPLSINDTYLIVVVTILLMCCIYVSCMHLICSIFQCTSNGGCTLLHDPTFFMPLPLSWSQNPISPSWKILRVLSWPIILYHNPNTSNLLLHSIPQSPKDMGWHPSITSGIPHPLQDCQHSPALICTKGREISST